MASVLVLNFTLGRLYTCLPPENVVALTRVVTQNPSSVQARLLLAQAHAVLNLPAAMQRSRSSSTKSRAWRPHGHAQNSRPAARSRRHLYEGACRAADEPRAGRGASPHNALTSAAYSFAGDASGSIPRTRGSRLERAIRRRRQGRRMSVLEAAAKTFPRDTPTLYAGRYLS
jgi:hypothetical protein